MDYILLASLMLTSVTLFVTYDIACQFSKNFGKRNQTFPPCMRLSNERAQEIRWAIPKAHYEGHGENHEHLCLNYLQYVGRSYGEGIESQWAHMNPTSMSTKEMAPSVRRETLDDHWSSWNWRKTCGLGEQWMPFRHAVISHGI